MTPARRTAAGFTLIEMLAVVAIFALLASMVLPAFSSLGARPLANEAERIASELEFARQRSVVTGVSHRLVLDLESGGYWLEWYATEAESSGEPGAAPADLDLRGNAPIPMAAPRGETREFRPVPGRFGSFTALDRDMAFAGVETAEGWIETGETFLVFERDGTTSFATIYLDDEDGHGIALEVLPLSDAVRVLDVEL